MSSNTFYLPSDCFPVKITHNHFTISAYSKHFYSKMSLGGLKMLLSALHLLRLFYDDGWFYLIAFYT